MNYANEAADKLNSMVVSPGKIGERYKEKNIIILTQQTGINLSTVNDNTSLFRSTHERSVRCVAGRSGRTDPPRTWRFMWSMGAFSCTVCPFCVNSAPV